MDPHCSTRVTYFPSGSLSADLVICSDVIEHIVDPDALLKFLSNIDTKFLVVSTPCRKVLCFDDKFKDGWGDSWNGPPINTCHVREWTMDEFILYLSTQFTVLESHYGESQTECQYHLLRPRPFRILYGAKDFYVDVTDTALKKCTNDNIITIPEGDAVRSSIFGDPWSAELKNIKVISNDGVATCVGDSDAIIINYYPRLNIVPDTKMHFKSLEVLYGANGTYGDITQAVLAFCVQNGHLEIPAGNGACDALFGDPLPGVLKHIKLTYQGVVTVFQADQAISLYEADEPAFVDEPVDINNPSDRLDVIHSELKFKGGDIRDTYPNQLMAVMFLNSTSKVLELGAGIGRNTLVIARLLDNSANLVAMECNSEAYLNLRSNRDANGLSFKIENAALSARPTYQKDWITYPDGKHPADSMRIPTTDLHYLKNKYSINFDTIVSDCEGALYYILQEYPDILANIRLLIMENNYSEASHLEYVDHVLKSNNFKCIFSKQGGWGPCTKRFHEVWTK